MSNFKFSIRTLLLALAVVAAYFPMRDVYEPWRRGRLQATHQIFSDYETLAMLKEGDSVQTVTGYYPMLSEIEPSTPKWNAIGNGFGASNNVLGASDSFYEYTLAEVGMFGYLHFRNGKLVDHPQEIFSDPVANAIRNGSSLPNFFDRLGFLPIYLAAIVGIGGLFFVARRFPRSVPDH